MRFTVYKNPTSISEIKSHDLILFPADCISAGRVRGKDNYKKFYTELIEHFNLNDIYTMRNEHRKQPNKAIFQDIAKEGSVTVLTPLFESKTWSDDTTIVIAMFCKYTYNDPIDYDMLKKCINNVENETFESVNPCIVYI